VEDTDVAAAAPAAAGAVDAVPAGADAAATGLAAGTAQQ